MNKFLSEARGVESEKTESLYAEIKTKFAVSSVPDFFKVLALNENILNGIWAGYEHILVGGKLQNSVKEMIFLTISLEKGCNDCSSTHIAICDMTEGVSEQNINYIKSDIEHVSPVKVREVLKLALQYLKAPEKITAKCFDNLKKLGLSTEEIIEVLAMCVLTNTAVNITLSLGLDLENDLREYLRENQLFTGLEDK